MILSQKNEMNKGGKSSRANTHGMLEFYSITLDAVSLSCISVSFCEWKDESLNKCIII